MSHQDIQRHQAPIKEEGKKHVKRQRITQEKVLARERISQQSHNQHPDAGANKRHRDGHAIGSQDLTGTLQDVLIGSRRERARKQRIAELADTGFRRERGRDPQDQRR